MARENKNDQKNLKESSGVGDKENWCKDWRCQESRVVANWRAKNSESNRVNSTNSKGQVVTKTEYLLLFAFCTLHVDTVRIYCNG